MRVNSVRRRSSSGIRAIFLSGRFWALPGGSRHLHRCMYFFAEAGIPGCVSCLWLLSCRPLRHAGGSIASQHANEHLSRIRSSSREDDTSPPSDSHCHAREVDSRKCESGADRGRLVRDASGTSIPRTVEASPRRVSASIGARAEDTVSTFATVSNQTWGLI